MFDFLRGTLTAKTPTSIVLDVNGIGFQVNIPVSTYERLPALQTTVQILTYHYVREDIQALYGFITREERELFLLLIGVSGIGPKSAITILSGTTPRRFRDQITAGDVPALTQIPGIGPKTARRIIVELGEKFGKDEALLPDDRLSVPAAGGGEEALKALLSLGYRRAEALTALRQAYQTLGPDAPPEKLIKTALQNM